MGLRWIEAPSVGSPLSHSVAMFSGTRCMVLPPVKDAMVGWSVAVVVVAVVAVICSDRCEFRSKGFFYFFILVAGT